MLNGKTVKISVGGEFVILDEGVYTAEVTDVNLLENVITSYAPDGKDMLDFRFRVLDEKEMTTPDGKKASTRGKELRHRMTPSLNEKATMSKLVKAVLGRVPTPQEVVSFNPESLIGKQVQVVVVQSPAKDGTIWNNIDNYMKVSTPLTAWDGEKASATEINKSTQPLSDDKLKEALGEI